MGEQYQILLIDTDDNTLVQGKMYLEQQLDCSVTPLSSTDSALQLILENSFHAIISHEGRPKIEGIKLLQDIRKKGDSTPFLIYTEDNDEELALLAYSSDADFYLFKKSTISTLFHELSRSITYAIARRKAKGLFVTKSNENLNDLLTKTEELSRLQSLHNDQENLLQMMQEIFHIGFWNYRLDRGTIQGSPEALRIYGYPPEPVEHPIEEIEACVNDRDTVHQVFIDFLKGNTPYDLEIRINPADGSPQKIVHSIALLERDEQNNPVRVIGVIQDITEQKRAEESLRESQERLRFALDGSNDGVWDIGMESGRVYISSRGWEIFGYNSAEMEEQTPIWKDLIHPDDIPATHQALDAYLEGKAPVFHIEHRVKSRTGEWKWVLARGKVISYTSEGKPARMIGTYTDISDRKQIEEKLAQKHYELQASYEQLVANEEELKQHFQDLAISEQMLQRRTNELQLIFKNMINAFIIWESVFDEDGKYVSFRFGFFNDAYARISKLSYEEVKGKDVFEVWPETEESWVQAYGQVATSGIPLTFEMYHEPTKGWYHCNAYRPTDSLDQVCVIFEDITERRRHEEVLNETNAYLESLIHLANVPIIVWDSEFRITRINHAFEILTGYHASDVLGKTLEFLFPPFKVERSMELIHATREGVKWDTVELEIQHVNGIVRTILWNSSTLYTVDGNTPIATIAQGLDITDLKRLESQRTIAYEQIKQNLAKLAVLNDEIRNPLTIIAVNAENLEDSYATRQILIQTKRIDDMIRQLDLRWIESDKVLRFLRRHHQIIFASKMTFDEE